MSYVATLIAALSCGVFISTYTAYILKSAQTAEQDTTDRKSSGTIEKQKQKRMIRDIIITGINLVVWFMLLRIYGLEVKFLLYALTSSALLGLSVIDLAIFEIPPQFNWFILAVGIAATVFDHQNWLSHLIGMFLVSGIFYLIALATKGRGMGGGDIKLMATVGLLLGWQEILLVMVLGCVLGAVIHSVIMKVSKKEHMLAFGPYLSAAALIVMCYGGTILQWYIGNFLTVHR